MLFGKQKSLLGVDIGTSDIKIAQLRPESGRFVLETYGTVNVSYQIASRDSAKGIEQVVAVLGTLLKKARVSATKVVASLPNSSVFTSVIEMPKIPMSEMKNAVEFEARKYVPLPLSEVALSWSVIESKTETQQRAAKASAFPEATEKNKVLLTAVPTVVIDNYLKVFKLLGLEPVALEIEALSLIRSLLPEAQGTVLVIDIGAKSTSLNLVEDGYLRLSKNLTVGGDTVTNSIAKSLSVNFARAEQFKKDFGLSAQQIQIPQIMRPILDVIKNEVLQLINLFESRGEHVTQIVLTGGSSRLPNIKEYFSQIGKPIVLASPWSKIMYDPKLKPVVEPLGINLAVALGLAMRQP